MIPSKHMPNAAGAKRRHTHPPTDNDMSRGGKREGAGRKPVSPDEKNVTVALSLPPAVVESLDAYAQSKGLSRSKAAASLIEKALS